MIAAPLREREPASYVLRYIPPGAAAVLALGRNRCRWPLGDVEDDGFRFCAATQTDGAYCAVHARLAGRQR